ncbi:MAG TPA: TetR/AcrR family transcriptional regulator [Dinghuibacter sp.]|uniref:TetR/AcrR family transcriptional regulator n=1 Tax=Dinghuibacter sp. TaxID=2024697 RepID=UPI002B84D4AB|nr:TetR/AcrR family transcriptional regulator [Dinghuibacter sp.]HTJ11304.1 TetR/AcrR family transcriptional regulator [Dinghuibacter sp.]
MSLPPQEEQAEILQAVLRLYRQFGPDKVAMDDIAKATGRSRTSLYYYYKNRDEVFRAAIDAIVLDIAKDLRKAVADVQPLEEKVFTFCVAKLRISREWKLILNSMWATMESKERLGHLKTTEGLHRKLVHQESLVLKEILAAAAEKKEIRVLSDEETDNWVFVITSGIRGIRNELPDQNLTQAVKASIRVLSDMATKWLKK